jgi:hypothetical protein
MEKCGLTEDKKMRDLLLKATKDPCLRAEFLSNPERVAKQFDVKLKPDLIEKIKRASAFIESLDDLRLPPGPIFYPVDPWINQIKEMELANVVRYLYLERWKWIFYPAPDIFSRGRFLNRERI